MIFKSKREAEKEMKKAGFYHLTRWTGPEDYEFHTRWKRIVLIDKKRMAEIVSVGNRYTLFVNDVSDSNFQYHTKKDPKFN